MKPISLGLLLFCFIAQSASANMAPFDPNDPRFRPRDPAEVSPAPAEDEDKNKKDEPKPKQNKKSEAKPKSK